jgi:hypothetical protein
MVATEILKGFNPRQSTRVARMIERQSQSQFFGDLVLHENLTNSLRCAGSSSKEKPFTLTFFRDVLHLKASKTGCSHERDLYPSQCTVISFRRVLLRRTPVSAEESVRILLDTTRK